MATNRISKLKNRRTDVILKADALNEAYSSIKEDDAVKYAIGAMQPIDNTYTRICMEEGERVKNQLISGLNKEVTVAEFEYQGSVTNNTHIRVHSDIDLLTLHSDFFTLEPPAAPKNRYPGDSLAELKKLRKDAVFVLGKAFPEVDVNSSPGKAIRLTGGSLRRKIDVVIGNWWDTVQYQNTRVSYERGVSILDTANDQRINNKPFLHNQRIDVRDIENNGNLRKVIRLLKSLKYDADNELNISSYDITAIAYSMPNSYLYTTYGHELILVENTRRWFLHLIENEQARLSLYVPNQTRKIFGIGGASLAGLKELFAELQDLINDVTNGLARSFKKLEEARILY